VETVLWVLVGMIGAIMLTALWVVAKLSSTNNVLVALQQRCDTAMSDIDVLLKHRHNLIPGLVDTIKGMTGYEKEMVIGVIEARAAALGAMNSEVKLQAEGNLTAQVSNLLSNVDSLPELRAIPEFTQLRQQLVECENRITAARRFYNLAIEEYNTVLGQFPGSWIGQKKRMSSRQHYDLGVERVLLDEPVAIKF
jgi:LemA protein